MNYRSLVILMVFACLSRQTSGQTLARTLGARAIQCDDGTGSGKTVTWDVSGTLDQSYQLHWPGTAPTGNSNYCVVDASGNMWWEEYPQLPPLTAGNIWCGNSLNAAQQMPPGQAGSILSINSSLMPEWSSSFPSSVTLSANQITSGTLGPGVNITVGSGSSITPGSGGNITANGLSGAGTGKYSGVVSIPKSAPSIDIPYSAITIGSVVMISITDPDASDFTVIPTVTNILPGTGFTVTFTAPYPNADGSLHYAVINP